MARWFGGLRSRALKDADGPGLLVLVFGAMSLSPVIIWTAGSVDLLITDQLSKFWTLTAPCLLFFVVIALAALISARVVAVAEIIFNGFKARVSAFPDKSGESVSMKPVKRSRSKPRKSRKLITDRDAEHQLDEVFFVEPAPEFQEPPTTSGTIPQVRDDEDSD